MPLFSTRLTAIVSVALVLLLLGVAAFLGIGARNVADDMRRDIGFVVIVADDASPADIAALKQRFAGAAYTSDYTYSSPEMVMQRWKTLMDDEGETDDLLDENPFAPEIEVNVKAPWANIDSLRAITTPLKLMPSVDDVKVHDTLVGEVNRTLSNIALILIIVAAVLLTISIVLINNTVRLTIYSRRFLIHTMKLVGATPGFIRAPMIRDNALGGLLAGFIADIVLTGTLAYFAGVVGAHGGKRAVAEISDLLLCVGSIEKNVVGVVQVDLPGEFLNHPAVGLAEHGGVHLCRGFGCRRRSGFQLPRGFLHHHLVAGHGGFQREGRGLILIFCHDA